MIYYGTTAHVYVLGMKDEGYYQRHHGKGAQEDANLPISIVQDPYPKHEDNLKDISEEIIWQNQSCIHSTDAKLICKEPSD